MNKGDLYKWEYKGSHADAIGYVEKNFRGSGEIRVVKVVYQAISQYPYMVNT